MMTYALLRALADLAARLPWKGLAALASGMAFCFWHGAPSRRREAVRAVEKHLAVSRREAVRIARESFKQNFLSFLEILHAGKFFLER